MTALPFALCDRRKEVSWCCAPLLLEMLTFNQPVRFILSHQMEVNNFLMELTSASILEGQPGLGMLFLV